MKKGFSHWQVCQIAKSCLPKDEDIRWHRYRYQKGIHSSPLEILKWAISQVYRMDLPLRLEVQWMKVALSISLHIWMLWVLFLPISPICQTLRGIFRIHLARYLKSDIDYEKTKETLIKNPFVPYDMVLFYQSMIYPSMGITLPDETVQGKLIEFELFDTYRERQERNGMTLQYQEE